MVVFVHYSSSVLLIGGLDHVILEITIMHKSEFKWHTLLA